MSPHHVSPLLDISCTAHLGGETVTLSRVHFPPPPEDGAGWLAPHHEGDRARALASFVAATNSSAIAAPFVLRAKQRGRVVAWAAPVRSTGLGGDPAEWYSEAVAARNASSRYALAARALELEQEERSVSFSGLNVATHLADLGYPGLGYDRAKQQSEPEEADEAKVSILVDMGFSKADSRSALRENQNDTDAAAESLLCRM